jgi:hypothetical protein
MKKKKNRIYSKQYRVRSLLLVCTPIPCTLPTAPVSIEFKEFFGLRSSYESVSLTPTKDPGKWNVTPLTAQRDHLAFISPTYTLENNSKLETTTKQQKNCTHDKTTKQLSTGHCQNCQLNCPLQYSGITHFSCRAAALLAANRQAQNDFKRHPTSSRQRPPNNNFQVEQHDQSSPTPGQQCTPPSHHQPNNNGQ